MQQFGFLLTQAEFQLVIYIWKTPYGITKSPSLQFPTVYLIQVCLLVLTHSHSLHNLVCRSAWINAIDLLMHVENMFC